MSARTSRTPILSSNLYCLNREWHSLCSVFRKSGLSRVKAPENIPDIVGIESVEPELALAAGTGLAVESELLYQDIA